MLPPKQRFRDSRYRYTEFCRCIECRYKQGCLYIFFYQSPYPKINEDTKEMPYLRSIALPKVRNQQGQSKRHIKNNNKKTNKLQTSTNRTNVRKTLRLAVSSPSEVMAMLKGLKNTRTK